MIVTKPGDHHLVALTNNLVNWLLNNYSYLVIYLDSFLQKKIKITNPPAKPTKHQQHSTSSANPESADANAAANNEKQKLSRVKYWSAKNFESDETYSDIFDLIITLGGDGTVLYVSQLFQSIVPPILAFSLGSLGFLTNFKYRNYQKILTKILRLKYVKTNLRLRLSCRIVEAQTKKVVMSKKILNEITIDRGPNPFLTNLALYGNDSLITMTQADGLCIATPTGSTAYSLAAGGSLVHPSVSAISVTPICPHTLSFRPIILPDSMELKVTIPKGSRCETSWVSFDGKSRFELSKKYYIVITASEYYFPTVMNGNNEYFDSVSNNLNWNTRKQQKPLNFSDNYDDKFLPGETSASLAVDDENELYVDVGEEDYSVNDDLESGKWNGNSDTSINGTNIENDSNGHGFGTDSFYQQGESATVSDDDFIETPIIPFQDINEALEIFSDEEQHDSDENGKPNQPRPFSKSMSRSLSSGSSKKIRTNSFTNFNQIYRDKLQLDPKKLSNKFNNLKINNGSGISIGVGDLKSSGNSNATHKHSNINNNYSATNSTLTTNKQHPHSTLTNSSKPAVERSNKPAPLSLHKPDNGETPQQQHPHQNDNANATRCSGIFELRSPGSYSSNESL